MRNLVRGLLALGVATIVAGASAAWACAVEGRVICAGTSADPVPVASAAVTLNNNPIEDSYDILGPVYTGADGTFRFDRVLWFGRWFDLGVVTDLESSHYDDAGFCSAWGVTENFSKAVIEVNASSCATGQGCEAVSGIQEGSFCLPSPIGRPKAECAYFGVPGLSVLDKNDGLSGYSTASTNAAAVALVKSGNCYNVYTNVTVGEVLSSPQGAGAISHVTYCGCPE